MLYVCMYVYAKYVVLMHLLLYYYTRARGGDLCALVADGCACTLAICLNECAERTARLGCGCIGLLHTRQIL